jgi:hypothetical protein
MNEIQLNSVIIIVAIVWGALLLLQGTPLTLNFFKPLTDISGILLILLGIFNKWAWRWRIFYPWLVRKPNIQGTWKGKLTSDWKDPQTQKRADSLEVYLVIVQEYSTVNAFLLSRESRSELLSGEIIKKVDGSYQFIYVYRNTPQLLLRENSPIHFGSVILDIAVNPKFSLEGEYWTDRGSRGQMEFDSFSKVRFSSFEDAIHGKYSERLKI